MECNKSEATVAVESMPLIVVFSLRKQIRKILSVGLVQCRYQVIQSTSSHEVHLKANQYAPRLVIADINEYNFMDILLVNRLTQSKRTEDTKLLAIVPKNLKSKLESLIGTKDSKSKSLLKERLQLIEFPFDFTYLLKKIDKMLKPSDEDEQNKDLKEDKSQDKPNSTQNGNILFDFNLSNEKKFSYIDSLLQKQWAFPFTIVKALDIIGSDESCTRELATCIKTDVSASAALLKVANTVFFAKRFGRITDVRDAIVRVGFTETKNLLSCFALINLSTKIRTKSGFTRNEFWLHSLATGIIAQKLCENVGFKHPELAFVSGILHDLGKIPLDNNFNDVFPKILEMTTSKIIAFYESEYELLNFSHSELGHYLLNKWNFPSVISQSILNHHNVEKIINTTPLSDRIIQEATYVANQLSKSTILGHSCDEVLQEIPVQMLDDLKVTSGFLNSFYLYTFKKLDFFSQFLNIQISDFKVKMPAKGKVLGAVAFIHGHHSPTHPIVISLKHNGYQVITEKRLTPEIQSAKRVIIIMPEPGRPLDIVFHDENHLDKKGDQTLKINIIDVDPTLTTDKGIDFSENMVFINQRHLDSRLVLHIVDKFYAVE
ncbi:MAG: HDOD domain-containing protein [Chitinispirillia bacterium]|jgi:putative nucleotidyltransferase with HDIG domain